MGLSSSTADLPAARLSSPVQTGSPAVAVVVPHFRGDVLHRCLGSVAADDDAPTCEIVVVEDGPGDEAVLRTARERFPAVRFVKTKGETGFGAACNAGIASTTAPLIVVLNNDVELRRGSLAAFVRAAAEHPEAAIFEAKVGSPAEPTRLDYAGAAGGLLDWLGHPFAHGRLFDVVEEECGQFDQVGEIFLACGVAMAVRRADFDDAGGFDPRFRMHMEEIDLARRLRLRGRVARKILDLAGNDLRAGTAIYKSAIALGRIASSHLRFRLKPLKRSAAGIFSAVE